MPSGSGCWRGEKLDVGLLEGIPDDDENGFVGAPVTEKFDRRDGGEGDGKLVVLVVG